jgi:hypothetical protein
MIDQVLIEKKVITLQISINRISVTKYSIINMEM